MNELLEFSLDTENAEKNYNLAQWYEEQGHTAPALTYYTRASERTEDKELAYVALLRGYYCYNSQGSRDNSAKILLQNAVAFYPKRPEAYFLLSQFYEKQENWQESYIYACIGLENCDHNLPDLIDDVGYPGKYGLIFQKAMCGYWWGKGQEARILFQELINNYEMEKTYYDLVVSNITRLGSGSKEIVFRQYTKENYNNLKFKFDGCENITENYSQVYQDMFALFMHNGKRNGTYLEVGSGDPFWLNNTYLLESQFGWKGVGLEYNSELCESHKNNRSNPVICQDAHQVNFKDLLNNTFDTKHIDYLQLDCEPSESTYRVLTSLPLDEYKFAVITYEHDYYVDISRTYRDKSREYLESKGYELVVSNVSPTSWSSFEDWWVHPDLVSRKRIEQIKNTDAAVKKIDDYMLGSWEDKHSIKRKIEKIYPDYDQRYGGWGWCTLDKAGCLIDYVNEICESTKDPVCVEIGVYAGKSILPVALELQRNKKGTVYAIDPWSNESAVEGYDGDNLIFWKNRNLALYLNIFKDSIKEFNLENYVSIIQSTSDDAPAISNINLLYIDGQHTIQALKDAEKYATQVELNGYCVVDDVNWGEVSEVPEYLKSIGFEFVNSVDVAQVFKRVKLQSANIIKTCNNTSWIVDNFYDDPDSIREFALKQEYVEGGIGRGFIGRRTEQQFLFPDLKGKFEEIMGRKITAWQEHGMNGRFQISWSGEPLVYHCDSQKWGGMLYLTPNAPYQCGTTLYAHKQTKARTYHEEGWDAAWKDVPGDCHLDGTSFEPVDVLGNVYNRLVIFDASAIHAASEYFGTVKENARLWQMFFFDTL